MKAPDAQKVRLHLDKDYDLAKDSSGVWSVTTTPQVPGFHYYWFILDGVNVRDPAGETFYGVSRQYSGIEVPEKSVDFYDVKDVPHGGGEDERGWVVQGRVNQIMDNLI